MNGTPSSQRESAKIDKTQRESHLHKYITMLALQGSESNGVIVVTIAEKPVECMDVDQSSNLARHLCCCQWLNLRVRDPG